MSLRIVYGRAGSGKTRYCLDGIKKSLDREAGKALVLIVPEQFSLQGERNLLKTIGAGGILRAEVLSFRRLAYRVFNEVGGTVHSHINNAGKSMMLYRIMDSLRDELKVFAGAARQKGFAGTISKMIAEFKRYDISPDKIINAAYELEPTESLKFKLDDLGLIYSQYENAIYNRYLDSDDDLTRLYEKLDKSKQYNGAEIWIDEFSGFTPQEYKVIRKLMEKAERVTISLCTDHLEEGGGFSNSLIFAPVVNTAEKLKTIAKQLNIKVEESVKLGYECGSDGGEKGRFGSNNELRHLEQNLFTYPYRKYVSASGNISIFAAANMFTEVEAAAREIIKLCRDKGMRYRDIALTCRDLDKYGSVISVILNEYGIPHFVDKKREITGHPLVALILSAMDIFRSNWSYESVFRYIKSGLSNLDAQNADLLENFVLSYGIRGNRWLRKDLWEAHTAGGNDDSALAGYELHSMKCIIDAREMLTAPLIAFHSKTRGRRTAAEICTALYELLLELEIPQRIDSRIQSFQKMGDLEKANEYSQVWNIAMEVFTQVVEVSGDDLIGLSRFCEILAAGFEEYSIGLIPPALDQVLVGSVDRSKSHEIKALFILGVNEGTFPASISEEGILSDTERSVLGRRGMELAKDSKNKLIDERFLAYSALSSPSELLKLSYPAADRDGRALRPSRLISDIKRIFPDIREYSDITGVDPDISEMDMLTSPGPAFNDMIAALRKAMEGEAIEECFRYLYSWFEHSDAWKQKCSSIIPGLSYSNQPGKLNNLKAMNLYRNPLRTSVSRLEAYSSCPFSYYVKFGLKAQERRISRLEPVDVGSFMHNILDEFSRSLVSLNKSWRSLDREWCTEQISKIVDEMLEKVSGAIFNSSRRYAYLSSRLKRIVIKAVLLIAEHMKRSGFEPIGYEVEFAEGGKYPPIMLELPSGIKMSLTGRIDRIDAMTNENGTYLRIVDYKSGNKALKLSDVYYGLQLQLLTYMDAVLEDTNGVGLLPGGVLYFRLDDPIVSGDRNSTEEDIEKAVMKQLKMKGLLLADVRLIKEMDRQIDGDSLIIPARLNKGDVLGRSSAATLEQFGVLRTHIKKTLSAIGDEIIEGNVAVSPYKKRTGSACIYCSYSSVCQFDPTVRENSYRFLNDIKDDDVWPLMRANKEAGDMADKAGFEEGKGASEV